MTDRTDSKKIADMSLIDDCRKELATFLAAYDAAMPAINEVCLMSQVHGAPYRGPKIDPAPLRALLARLEAASGDGSGEWLRNIAPAVETAVGFYLGNFGGSADTDLPTEWGRRICAFADRYDALVAEVASLRAALGAAVQEGGAG